MTTKTDEKKQDKVKQNGAGGDMTDTYLSEETLNGIIMNHINERHVAPKTLVCVTKRTAKSGGGAIVRHVDEAE